MKVKMTDLVWYFNNSTRRSAEEQNKATAIKQERAAHRPRRTKDYVADDLPHKGKDFPWRLRWIGCNHIDNTFQDLSVTLEDFNIQTTKCKYFRTLLRFKLNTYTLKDNDMSVTFRVFMMAYFKDTKAVVTLKTETPCINI
jgi:hypothetical protein